MRSNLIEGVGLLHWTLGEGLQPQVAKPDPGQTQAICLLKDDPNQHFQVGVLGALSPLIQKVPQKRKGRGKGKVL